MSLVIPTLLKKTLDRIESEMIAIDEFSIVSRIHSELPEPESLLPEERKAIYAEDAAFRFYANEDESPGRWGIYWREMMSGQLTTGEEILNPDIKNIDEEILTYWIKRLNRP